jgi:BirA family biotin operon repressor/biotin-[acetyl-CoA-carboxylase] ligase
MTGWEGRLADNLVFHEETGSTNDDLRELAAAGKAWDGLVVLAERQTAGRGRKGSGWHCEPGAGLAFSVLVHPSWPRDRWGWVSLAAGLAVAEAVETWALAPSIKWPNDVLLEGRKFCGILTEASGEDVIVGIGLNVRGDGSGLPEGVEATTLEAVRGEPLARELVLERVWQSLGQVLRRSTGEVAEAVWDRLAWRDERVIVRRGGREVTGVVRAFGPCGELMVQTDDGLQAVSDVSSLRRADG